MRSSRSLFAALVAIGLLASSCTSDDSDSSDTSDNSVTQPVVSGGDATTTAPPETSAADTTTAATVPVETVDTPLPTTSSPPIAADFTMRAGVNQVAVVGAEPGEQLQIVPADGAEATAGTVDEQGSFLWRMLPVGDYTVQSIGQQPAESDVVTVISGDDAPDQSLYSDQTMEAPGFGYITTRDGTTLGANVMLPGPIEDGPYPTVVEYSGYAPSNPDSATFGLLFNTLGFAYVGVNMRGTGCSGGSYLFFEKAQVVDGYDIIETVAAQSWVQDNRVGMVGISYPGISQLFVAQTQPPSLAAITPLSVLDDSYRATGEPGGILNTGFAAPFLAERQAEAEVYGQEWSKERADAGDTVCAENQQLRLQNPDFLQLTKDQEFYDPAEADSLSPSTFVAKIEVPVFLAGAWQDEQTGGHFPNMLDDFTGTDHLYADLTNGLHTDSLSPTIFARMVEFLNLYVAERTPTLDGARTVASILVPQLYGVDDAVLPADRFTGMSFEDALAAFEADPPIRVLFEQGTGGGEPGAPYPGFVSGFSAWPIPEAEPTSWYLADRGLLATKEQTDGTPDEYTADPDALPPAFYPGGRSSDIWQAGTVYDWQPIPDGTGVGYATAPLEDDTVVIGTGAVTLWVSSSAADTDLEVTISEVRPDGTEMYIQSGWLRVSHRALDEEASTEILPVQTHAEADAEPIPDDEFVEAQVELFPFAYAFRAGSQIRITVDAPGNSRPVWEFDTISDGETVTIAHDADHPSRLVLPVVAGIAVPPGAPACGALRGQPCRSYLTALNEVLPF